MIYDWSFYLSPAVVKSFEQKYGVSARVTTVTRIDEAINKVRVELPADANDLTIDKVTAAKVAKPHEIEMAFSPPDFQKNGIPFPSWNAQQLQTIEQPFAQRSA